MISMVLNGRMRQTKGNLPFIFVNMGLENRASLVLVIMRFLSFICIQKLYSRKPAGYDVKISDNRDGQLGSFAEISNSL